MMIKAPPSKVIDRENGDGKMFREMRRVDRRLSMNDWELLLSNCSHGILSVIGENGYPYGVSVNYAFADGKIYFHSTSRESHKLDAIRQNSKACFTVVDTHDIVLEELSTNYASVVIFGTACIIDDPDERTKAMAKMMSVLGRDTEYATSYHCDASAYVMVEITPDHISGKARNYAKCHNRLNIPGPTDSAADTAANSDDI